MNQHRDDTGWVRLDDLKVTLQLRPELGAHVRRLVVVLDDLPPILVARDSCVLIDGHMRVAAARASGRTRLPVTWTSGTPAGLLEQAVIANGRHGVPLNVAQRKTAAVRLLETAPGWSNGRVAKACGISEAVVRRLPRPGPSPTDVDSPFPRPGPLPADVVSRLGADGKYYPQGQDAQDAARALLAEHPDMPDRAIARATALSPTTVGRLRKQAIADGLSGPASDVAAKVVQQEAGHRETTGSGRLRLAAGFAALVRWLRGTLRQLRRLLRQ